MKSIFTGLFFLLILPVLVNAQNIITGEKFDQKTNWPVLEENIAHYSLYRIDINKQDINAKGTNIHLILDLGDQQFDLNLYPDNVKTSVEYKNRAHLLGGSFRHGGVVSLTINDNFINGFFRYGNSYRFIEKLKNFDKNAPDNVYVLYEAKDVIETGEHICGVEAAYDKSREFEYKSMPTTMCKVIDLAIANTYDMVTAEGSVQNVENHNLAVLNNVQTNYRSEFNANLEFDVVAHFIPASSGADPFPGTVNAVTLLNFLDSWGNGGGNSGGAGGGFATSYTQASLWTDRDIEYNGNSWTVGLAQTPGWHHLLENYTNSSASLMSMVSHEKGHNFSAQHDASGSNYIMAPSVTITTNWSSASVSSINSRISSQGYLSNCSTLGPPDANFFQSAIAICTGSDVEYEDQSQYGATRSWSFLGGNPLTGTDAKETVNYPVAGLWATEITSTNGAGSDIHLGYVDAQAEPTVSCTPNNPGGGSLAGITSFVLESISNSSSGSTPNSEYSNYICGNVATLEPNTTYSFTVSVGNCSSSIFERFRLYIDYNGDGDFTDSGESAYYTGGTSYCGSITKDFTTPANPQTATLLRLRIISNNNSINTPCVSPGSGETEDYGVYFPVAQIFGCTDPAATNYDPTATVDDGSCTYGSNTWYADNDSDTFGDPNNSLTLPTQPPGYVANNTDCDDTDDTVYPGAPELCDGQINNCGGFLPGNEIDNDGDGHVECIIDGGGWDGTPSVVGGDDCDDTDPNNYPGNTEVCDGQDNDCDGQTDEGVLITFFRDLDDDTFGNPNNTVQACSAPNGYVTNNNDCNDFDGTVYPGAPELCDGQDNDCNGNLHSNEVDNDGDGYVECTIDAGGWDGSSSVVGGDDCFDNDPDNYPGNTEVCDGKDNDCDNMVDEGLTTTYYRDMDGDTYGDDSNTIQDCSMPNGYAAVGGDCEDMDNTIYPGAPEICDGKDNDCDNEIDEGLATTWYRDIDGDSYGDNSNTVQACSAPNGYVDIGDDCDDTENSVYPDANEICDGLDNDCDSFIDEPCQPCEGDYLVIHTITQNSYHAEISITSDASVNNGQQVNFFAGSEIILDPEFEVVLGTEFNALIEDCVPSNSTPDDGNTQYLKSSSTEELIDAVLLMLNDGPVSLKVFDRWGTIYHEGTLSAEEDVRKAILSFSKEMSPDIYNIEFRVQDKKFIQNLWITDK